MNYQVTYNLLNQTINSIIVRDIAHCALQGIYVHSWRKRSPGQLPSAGNCFLITPFLALLVSEVVDCGDDDEDRAKWLQEYRNGLSSFLSQAYIT